MNNNLDYETDTQHIITIQASDGGGMNSTQNAVVTVIVLDVNEHTPVFKPSGPFIINEGPAPSTPKLITTVTATDDDTGTASGTVCYELLTTGLENVFSFDPVS